MDRGRAPKRKFGAGLGFVAYAPDGPGDEADAGHADRTRREGDPGEGSEPGDGHDGERAEANVGDAMTLALTRKG